MSDTSMSDGESVTAVSGQTDGPPEETTAPSPDPGPARPAIDVVRDDLRSNAHEWRRVYEAMDWRGEALGVVGALSGGGFMCECEEVSRNDDGALMTVHVWACYVEQPFTPLQ